MKKNSPKPISDSGFTRPNFLKKNLGGFTLIELLVAVAVFSVMIGATSGLFVSAIVAQRKTLVSQELLDQTSYVMEYMSRALRMARKDLSGSCLRTAGAGYNYESETGRIPFLNYNKKCQEFFMEGEQLKERKSSDERAINFGTPPLPLTSSSLQVNSFNIGVLGWTQEDNLQPRVTVFLNIRGKGGKPESQPEIKIQTTVSQRNLDIRQ